jgi:hypothetical protein
MRDSAQLRRDVAVVQRYLTSLRALNGDRTGGAPRRASTARTATPVRSIDTRLATGSSAGGSDTRVAAGRGLSDSGRGHGRSATV